jgi:hypothetical protein
LLDQLPIGDIVLDHPEHVLRRLFEHTRLEIHYDHRARIATYRCLLTGETIGQLRALTTRYFLPTGDIGADASPTPARGQLVVSGYALTATSTARLAHDGDLASAAFTVELETLSHHRCMP